MDRLEHKSYRFHLVPGCNRKYISVKMNSTARYLASGKTSGMVSSIPRFLSPMVRRTPVSPRSFSHTKKERQLSRSSFMPSAAPRISRQPSWLTPMATGTETFWISPPPSCVSGKHHLRKHTDNSRKADGYARSRYAHKPFYSGC